MNLAYQSLVRKHGRLAVQPLAPDQHWLIPKIGGKSEDGDGLVWKMWGKEG